MPVAERERAAGEVAAKAAAAGSAEPTLSLLRLLRAPRLLLSPAKPRRCRASSEARTAFEQVAGRSLLASRRE